MPGGVIRFRPDVLLDALPASTGTYFSGDAVLADALRRGGTTVSEHGDIEVAASAADLVASAPAAVIVTDGRLRARRETRLLRARGYDVVRVRRWWPGMAFGTSPRPPRGARAEGAAAIVGRSANGGSALAAVLEAAAESLGEPLDVDRVWIRSTGLIGMGSRTVLRVGVGRTAELLARHVATLRRIQADPGDHVRGLAPAVIAAGVAGSAAWAVEERLPGKPPASPLDPARLRSCADVLAAMHVATRGPVPGAAADMAADAVATAQTAGIDSEFVEAARAADARLHGLVGGMGHGDFWSGNLLCDVDRLTGIVDWAAGADDAYPFVDLLHLLVTAQRVPVRASLGEAIAQWLRRGQPDAAFRPALEHYTRRAVLELEPESLQALAVVYWVQQIARHVVQFAGLDDLEDWAKRNVAPVLSALG